MPATSAAHDSSDFTQNYRGGLKLLHLATEQIRIFDPVAAEQISRGCLQPLQVWFERTITSVPHKTQGKGHSDTARRLQYMRQVSQDAWSQEIKPHVPPHIPPDLGFDNLGCQEARPGEKAESAVLISQRWRVNYISGGTDDKTPFASSPSERLGSTLGSAHQPASYLLSSAERAATSTTVPQQAPYGSRESRHQSRDYGAIGSQKASTDTTQSDKSKGDRSAMSPGNHIDFSAAVKAHVSANKEDLLGSILLQRQRENLTGDINGNSLINKASTPASSWDGAATSRASQVNKIEAAEPPPALCPASWAKVVAMTANNGPSQPGGIIALPGKAATTSLVRSQPRPRRPAEPPANMHRAVYLARLPLAFTLRDVSAQIVQGPVMSVLLATDVDASMPGKSACIIFMAADACSTFLASNGWDFSRNKFTGPTSYATDPVIPGLRRMSGLTDIELIPCGPYPLDSHLLSMAHPTNARRRIKWSRSRLFYDVSQRRFKRDVLSVVGGPSNVEFFHFYNPGECTVVFASVGVAAACLERFHEWSKEKLEGAMRWLKEDDVAGHVAGNGGGKSRQGKDVGHLDKKKGRYEDVEVMFVKDFNECPTVLYSQYGRDGQLSERVEGLYEGPAVPWP